ncbi:MAG: hypothetical protein KDA92_02970 [Planctomycetales bacterium]|nr:hypothetical protein [Planctomycetales bacterium]
MFTLASSLLIVATTVARPAQPWVVDQCEVYHCESYAGELSYRLHVPSDERMSPRPLVIWLHGAGEAGSDNRRQLAWLELVWKTPSDAKLAPYYLLAVQRPADAPSWFQVDGHLRDPLDQLDAVLEDVLGRHEIDGHRVYLAGVSQGASGAWAYAIRHPQRFAGMLLFGPPEAPTELPVSLKRLPIWVFQSTGDGIEKLRRLQSVARRFSALGGQMAVTAVPNDSHDCWTAALNDYAAWSWLTAQQQDRWSPFAPGWPPRRVVNVAAWLLVGVTLAGLLGRRLLSSGSCGRCRLIH